MDSPSINSPFCQVFAHFYSDLGYTEQLSEILIKLKICKWAMKRKIIAASWHPGGANAILPVIKKLEEDGRVNIITIGYQYSEKIFQNGSIKYKTIDSYGLSDVSPESMSCLLRTESPDLVLTGAGVQYEDAKYVIDQSLILAARENGIRTLSVIDLFEKYSAAFSDIFTGEKFKFLPDRIAIMNKLVEDTMLKEGFNKEKLVVTGNPYFDELTELKQKFSESDRQKVRAELGVDSKAYLLLYASQPIEHDHGKKYGYTEKTALKELLDALEKMQQRKTISLLVKVHPRENKQDLEKIVKGYDLPVVVDQSYPTRLSVLASDVVISPFSTVLVDSSYLDKPSISLQPGLNNLKDDPLITNKLGVTDHVYKKGEIGDVLEKLLFDKNYTQKLAQGRKDFRTDGKATERVAELVYKMIE